MGGGISKMANHELVATIRDRYQQVSKKDKGRILKSSPEGLWPCRSRGAGPRAHGQRVRTGLQIGF